MLELLAPAGSMESVTAAVQSGADALYMGYGDFNARRNAKNFSEEEFAAAVSYCHLRGCKVYLTLNTLLTDRELAVAQETARTASAIGVDAVLVQDLGVLRMVKQVAPDLPVHASTQMTVHNLDGVKKMADLGMSRAVLSRELDRNAISYICEHSPIEIETFAHGALCMCYSGQCFMSSVIGGRSGNRGLCAQPCRLPYGWGDKANAYPLSLKDMSLAGYLSDLRKMGVACVKLEGRMKRPEYVSVVTGIYARAIRENREPTAEEMAQLAAAFSRQGFTQGYFLDKHGPDMFGVREETAEPRELFAQARSHYQNGELPRVSVTFYAMVRRGEPVQVGVEDDKGRVATATGAVPEAAINRELTAEVVEKQLSRTGGTPYRCEKVRAMVEPGLSLPVAAFNALRRSVLEDLSARRSAKPERRHDAFHPGVRYENRAEAPVWTCSVRKADQVSRELYDLEPAMIYVPVEELAAHPEVLEGRDPARFGAILPRIAWDKEWPALESILAAVRALGVKDALIGNLGMVEVARRAGFDLRGDFGLEVYNSQALKELKHMGLKSATLSFELKFPQIRDISKNMDTELITYGRLPLMITENCIISNRRGGGPDKCKCACENENILTDRKGARFPVVRACGHRNEILNCQKLFLADKSADYWHIGLWAQRLLFTTENPRECAQLAQRYLEAGRWTPAEYTRGLYYRDVE